MVPSRPFAQVIVNPSAGGGRAGRRYEHLLAALRRHGIAHDVSFTEGPGDARALAETAARLGCDFVIPFGGDGTASEVANGLLAVPDPPPLAPIQSGSVNAIAHFMGFRGSEMAQVQLLQAGRERQVDVGWIEYQGADGLERRAFLLFAGTGWNAALMERAHAYRRIGSAATYVLAGAREWWGITSTLSAITTDGDRHHAPLSDVQVFNGPLGGRWLTMAPGADPFDGQLNAMLITGAGRLDLLRMFAGLRNGSHIHHHRVDYRETTSLSIAPERPLPVQVDGDIVGTTPMTISVQPGALRAIGAGTISG